MSAKAVGSESSELSNLLQTVRIQTTVSLIHLKHFWYFTDSSTKMRITKRMLRTKQVLILMTSGLFLFGTIWFASHPDAHPLVSQIPQNYRRLEIKPPETKNFPDHHQLLELLGAALPVTDSPGGGDGNTGSDISDQFNVDNMDMQEFIDLRPVWNLPDQLPTWINTSAPVVLTALYYEDTVLQLADSIRNDPPNQLVVFDLRKENKADSDKVEIYCNMTRICSVVKPPMDELPQYIQKKDFGGYKPVLIQKSLTVFPMMLWLDAELNPLKVGSLDAVWEHTSRHNITTWQRADRCVMSSYTYKDVLPYFGLRIEELYYSTMIQNDKYALKYTTSTAELLRKWLQCALTKYCLSIGNTPCDKSCTQQKPVYKYTGCHMHEATALALSLFKLNCQPRDYLVNYPLEDSSLSVNMSAINILIDRQRAKMAAHSRRRNGVNLP